MEKKTLLKFVDDLLQNMPADWLKLTTHRLDIYDESLAKTQFLGKLKDLYDKGDTSSAALAALPTAYDYIRLGHPLSCVLEWTIAHLVNLAPERVISFSSKTTPLLAVLRKNHLDKKRTQIVYSGALPACFDAETIRRVYGYQFELRPVDGIEDLSAAEGSTIFVSEQAQVASLKLNATVDFYLHLHGSRGSVLLINGEANEDYIADVQHVRRRETIAMTPADCLAALKAEAPKDTKGSDDANRKRVLASIASVTNAGTDALVASSGLSLQYAIMMGVVDDALENHAGKAIKIVVPPNCYGGTNDQARRVAACLESVEIVDLLVDGENDMVQSIDTVLNQIANDDAVAYIIAEIPTNPRVEVPDLLKLKEVLGATRKTSRGESAASPVFILDQTFCPNVHFLGENDILADVMSVSYVSGSKFPSGGRCTAGYCVGNQKAGALMKKIGEHLRLCDNEATSLQVEVLAEQMPSMNQRIADAYKNTRDFVEFIRETLPDAKINFVSQGLAKEGFTPSVFSLDLPTKGDSDEERETYKRASNLKLINLMINEIPDESKFCVSYGQLKGCYWTIPATSTQGTTKESDKDYIVRASLSGNMNLARHKEVFTRFVEGLVL